MRCLLLLFLYFFIIQVGYSKIIFVDQNAQGQSNGLDWSNAFTDLQVAIDSAASGDTLWVSASEYNPDFGPLLTSIGYEIDKVLHLFGGFQGNEAELNERNSAGRTILNIGTNLLLFKNPGDTCVVDGFEIKRGGLYNGGWVGNDEPPCDTVYSDGRWCFGGGIYFYTDTVQLSTSFLIIQNCDFSDCWNRGYGGCIRVSSHLGGGVGTYIENCTFINSSARGWGGAVSIELGNGQNADCTIVDCTFLKCRSSNYTGAVDLYSADTTVRFSIRDCQFIENSSGFYGPTALTYYQVDKYLDVENCLFQGNRRSFFLNGVIGTIFGGNVRISDCVFDNNNTNSRGVLYGRRFQVQNSIFTNNFSDRNTAVMSVFDTAVFTNCTFANNSSDELEGIGFFHEADVEFNNCLFQANQSAGSRLFHLGENNRLKIQNSIFDFKKDSLIFSISPTLNTLVLEDPNLFETSIFFQDTSQANYAPSGCSIARNFGDSSLLPPDFPTTDITGAPRIQDGQIDVGAYESGSFEGFVEVRPSTCDSSENGSVRYFADNSMGILQAFWLHDSMMTNLLRNDLAAGDYSFILSDAAGCSDTLDVSVGVAAAPFIVFDSIQNASGINQSDGAIYLNFEPSSDSTIYHVSWSNGDTGRILSNVMAGTYMAKVTDFFGCEMIYEGEVTMTNSVLPTTSIQNLKLMPNICFPKQKIYITENNEKSTCDHFNIFSNSGRLLFSKSNSDSFFSPEKSGFYLAEIKINGETHWLHIIVQ